MLFGEVFAVGVQGLAGVNRLLVPTKRPLVLAPRPHVVQMPGFPIRVELRDLACIPTWGESRNLGPHNLAAATLAIAISLGTDYARNRKLVAVEVDLAKNFTIAIPAQVNRLIYRCFHLFASRFEFWFEASSLPCPARKRGKEKVRPVALPY